MDITVNQSQQLFVCKSGSSISCLGFRMVYERACELVNRLLKAGVHIDPSRRAQGEPLAMPKETEIGTLGQYNFYQALMTAYLQLGDKDTWYTEATPDKVRAVLERYRKSGDLLRVFYGDVATGRDWLEEFETLGRVSRSTGPMKVPLLVHAGESGGSALLTNCIVRMLDGRSGKEVYRHSSYHTPEMELRRLTNEVCATRKEEAPVLLTAKGYTHGVWVRDRDGTMANHANFKSMGKAALWLAYMSGERVLFEEG